MKRLAMAVVLGLLVGVVAALAASAEADVPLIAVIDNVEVAMACDGPIVTEEFQISAPHADDKEPGFTAPDIPTKVRNPLNSDRGVPADLDQVTDKIYVKSDRGEEATLVAVAEPYAGDEYMLSRFVYCEGSKLTPDDLFPIEFRVGEDGVFLDEEGNLTDG